MSSSLSQSSPARPICWRSMRPSRPPTRGNTRRIRHRRPRNPWLAQNSNDATKQIHARIKGIQNETNQVAITIEHATQQVVLLSDLVTRTGSALHAIDTVIQRVASVIATVHQTAEEQARATAIVSGTMSNIADITGTTWESAEQMRASMDHMAELAGILQAKIDMFRLSERLQATRSHGPPDAAASLNASQEYPDARQVIPRRLVPGGAIRPIAASFPAKSFPGAPAPDPYARSTSAATPPTGACHEHAGSQ